MIETRGYCLHSGEAIFRLIVPVKQLEIVAELNSKKYSNSKWETMNESKRIYAERFPEEAKEYYKEKLNLLNSTRLLRVNVKSRWRKTIRQKV